MRKGNGAIYYPAKIQENQVFVFVNQYVFNPDKSVQVIDYSMRNAMRGIPDLAKLVGNYIQSGIANRNFIPLAKDEGTLLGVLLPYHTSKKVALRALSQCIDSLLEYNDLHPNCEVHMPLPLRWHKKISNYEVLQELSVLPDNFIIYR